MHKILFTALVVGSLSIAHFAGAQPTSTTTPNKPDQAAPTPSATTPPQPVQTPTTPSSPAPTPATPSSASAPTSSAPIAADKWKPYSYTENGFSVSLPLPPEHTHQELTLPNSQLKIPYDIYISDPSDKLSFLVGVAQYPKEINVSVPENNLKAAVNGTLGSTPGGKLISSTPGTSMNSPSIDFTIEGTNYNMKGRYILVGHTLYQLMVAYDKGINVDSDYSTFLNSFKISQ